MALLGMCVKERIVDYDSLLLLPGLEENVLFDDIIIPDLDESFTAGIDDWWGGFIADMCL